MSRMLDIHPAFGYESHERWKVAVVQRDEYLKNQGKNGGDYHRWGRVRMIVNNGAKILALFPGLNIIIGVARIILGVQDYRKTSMEVKKSIAARHIVRGALDISFGPLMIIPDIVATILDHRVVNKMQHIPSSL